jgi:hypothetical protein
MRPKRFDEMNCGVAQALEVVDDWCTPRGACSGGAI